MRLNLAEETRKKTFNLPPSNNVVPLLPVRIQFAKTVKYCCKMPAVHLIIVAAIMTHKCSLKVKLWRTSHP